MYFCAYLKTGVNVSYFIARKMIKGDAGGKNASRPVVKISILSIALGIFVMILTLSIVTGFKNQVRNKVIGFGSHIQIMQAGGSNIFEAQPIRNDRAMSNMLSKTRGVQSVSTVAYCPGIFQSKGDSVKFTTSTGKEIFRMQQDIRGVMFKGIDDSYDQSFFKKHLLQGETLQFADSSKPYELLISNKVASQMQFKVGDEIPVYFVHDKPFRRNFVVSGIFETGLDDFDGELALAKLNTIQKLSGWGVESSISLSDTLYKNRLLITVNTQGGLGRVRYDWGDGFSTLNQNAFVPTKDTVFRVVTSTYDFSPYEASSINAVQDTTYFHVMVKGNVFSGPPEMENGKLKKTFLDDDGFKYSINVGTATIVFEEIPGKGTAEHYISGYEILVNSWEQLAQTGEEVKREAVFRSLENDSPVDVLTIRDVYPDIFTWLDFLDINFSIIVILMIAISVITMGASLLVLILEKTSAIGILKAMGASDWLVRKVFLYQAAQLILKGMFWGNFAGILIALLQMKFTIFPLDPQVYYLNAVPIEINWMYLLLLNVFTIVICVLVLIIPSYFITKIKPTESIKFS